MAGWLSWGRHLFRIPGPASLETIEVKMITQELDFPEWIEVFAKGRWTDSEGNTKDWTFGDLLKIASSYNPQVYRAPIVIGHPETDSPAYGWIDALKIEGDKLLAKPGQLVDEFIDWINRGLYKKISISLFPDMSLRHVGFLGGTAPAVQGLRPVEFTSKKMAWTFEMEVTTKFTEPMIRDLVGEKMKANPNLSPGMAFSKVIDENPEIVLKIGEDTQASLDPELRASLLSKLVELKLKEKKNLYYGEAFSEVQRENPDLTKLYQRDLWNMQNRRS
jgi:hypothetical protein